MGNMSIVFELVLFLLYFDKCNLQVLCFQYILCHSAKSEIQCSITCGEHLTTAIASSYSMIIASKLNYFSLD